MDHSIYFVGASGTGKTTLAEYVEREYGVYRLPSASRLVFKESFAKKYKDYAELIADKGAYFKFQLAVCQLQADMENAARADHGVFVSDRSFDHLVYAALYGSGAEVIGNSWTMSTYMDKMQVSYGAYGARPIFFFCRPVEEIRAHAVVQGDRSNFLDWDEMNRFDGACKLIFETQGLPYTNIDVYYMEDRRRLIDGVLLADGIKKKGA